MLTGYYTDSCFSNTVHITVNYDRSMQHHKVWKY